MNRPMISARFSITQLEERLSLPLSQARIAFLVALNKKKAHILERCHLEASLDLLKRFKSTGIQFILADELQRHCFWNSALYPQWHQYSATDLQKALQDSSSLLLEEAKQKGRDWQILNAETFKTQWEPMMVGWEEVQAGSQYQKMFTAVKSLYENDRLYQQVVKNASDAHIFQHRQEIRTQHRALAKKKWIEYLLEECPLVFPSVVLTDYVVSPNDAALVMQETYRRLYPHQKLPWFSLRYVVHLPKTNPVTRGSTRFPNHPHPEEKGEAADQSSLLLNNIFSMEVAREKIAK